MTLSRRTARYVLVFSLLGVGMAGAATVTAYRDSVEAYFSAAPDSTEASAVTRDESNKVGPSQTIPVRAFAVQPAGQLSQQRTLTGIVRARHETSLAFRVNGKVVRRYVEVGQRVQPGQLLYALDDEDYRLQQKSAAASLVIADANVVQTTAEEKRQRELLTSNAISKSDYERSIALRDAALGQQETARKQLELANHQIEYCSLTADAAGIITSIDVEAGQVVAIGTRVCSLAQTEELEAVVDLPENRLPGDQEVVTTVRFWSIPGVEVNARMRELSPIADAVSRTYRARFTLLNPPTQVQLGMTATVNLPSPSAQEQGSTLTYRVPPSSLFQREGQPSIWLIDQDTGVITPRLVQIRQYANDAVFIEADLTPGTLIVSAGAHKLDEHQHVRVWETME